MGRKRPGAAGAGAEAGAAAKREQVRERQFRVVQKDERIINKAAAATPASDDPLDSTGTPDLTYASSGGDCGEKVNNLIRFHQKTLKLDPVLEEIQESVSEGARFERLFLETLSEKRNQLHLI